jgi:molecular chaperone GrpE (heat shock protein)
LTGEDLDQAEKAELASFRELEDELKATTRACEIAQAEYERLWRLASSEVVAARQPEHRALVAEITESLKGLVEAIRAEEAWVRDLKDEGVYFVAGLGRTCNPQSKETTPLFAMLRKVNVGAFCERLKRHGYL